MKCKHSLWHQKYTCEEKHGVKPFWKAKHTIWYQKNDDDNLGKGTFRKAMDSYIKEIRKKQDNPDYEENRKGGLKRKNAY